MAELTDVKGVSDSRANDLRAEGFTTVDDIATASTSELSEVSGIGSSTAEDLIESAQNVIRDDTLDDSEEDSEEEEQTQDAEADAEPEGPSEEELRELVEEQPSEEPSVEDVDAEDDEGGSEVVDVEAAEPYPVEIEIDSDRQYDYFYMVALDLRTNRVYVSGPQQSLAQDLLDALRGLSGAGVVEIELDTGELNALHAAVVKSKNAHQGGANEAHTTIADVEGQVEAAREKYVL